MAERQCLDCRPPHTPIRKVTGCLITQKLLARIGRHESGNAEEIYTVGFQHALSHFLRSPTRTPEAALQSTIDDFARLEKGIEGILSG
jgi:hypothetical protein